MASSADGCARLSSPRFAKEEAVKQELHAVAPDAPRPEATPDAGRTPTRRLSPACAATSTICWPVSGAGSLTNAGKSEPPTLRRFHEIRRRTRPMGAFRDKISVDRVRHLPAREQEVGYQVQAAKLVRWLSCGRRAPVCQPAHPPAVTLGSEPGTADRSKKNCACNPDPISGFNTDQRLILIRRVRFGHRPHARGPTSL